MEEVLIRKATGDRVAFNADAIRVTVRRAGATHDEAEAVIRDVRERIQNGMTTRDVYTEVEKALQRRNRGLAAKYGLKQALYRLGPAGFHFEKYLVALFRAHDFTAELPEEYQGGCVKQEVDLALHKADRAYAVEAKLRQENARVVDLKIALTTYARFLDLLDGAALQRCPKFDAMWIVTNGHFSDRAAMYAKCKGMLLTGWNYPEGQGLNTMIDRTGLYPLTIIRELSTRELAAFSAVDIMLCRDIVRDEPENISRRTGLPQSRIEELVILAGEIVQ